MLSRNKSKESILLGGQLEPEGFRPSLARSAGPGCDGLSARFSTHFCGILLRDQYESRELMKSFVMLFQRRCEIGPKGGRGAGETTVRVTKRRVLSPKSRLFSALSSAPYEYFNNTEIPRSTRR